MRLVDATVALAMVSRTLDFSFSRLKGLFLFRLSLRKREELGAGAVPRAMGRPVEDVGIWKDGGVDRVVGEVGDALSSRAASASVSRTTRDCWGWGRRVRGSCLYNIAIFSRPGVFL